MNRATFVMVIALSSLVLSSCATSHGTAHYVSPYRASWVKQQIAAYEAPTKEAVSRITHKASYAGKPAYLIPSPCCDQYDFLYDARGNILCAPSGGFGGRGDGSCPEVMATIGGRQL